MLLGGGRLDEGEVGKSVMEIVGSKFQEWKCEVDSRGEMRWLVGWLVGEHRWRQNFGAEAVKWRPPAWDLLTFKVGIWTLVEHPTLANW